MGKMKWLPWTGLALAALASPAFAQQNTTQQAPKEELKMVIIKKTIDDNGIETIERIEKTGSALEMRNIEEKYLMPKIGEKQMNLDVEIKGLDKMDSDRVQSLEQTLNKVVDIENLDIDIELSDINTMEKNEDLLFMYKEAKNEERPFLGVVIETHEAGVKITEITKGAAAEAAGLKAGDVIKEIQGQQIASVEALQSAIRSQKIGETIKVGYLRDNQAAYTNATLKARENDHFVVRRHIDRGYANHHVYQASKELQDPCKKLEELNGTPFIGIYVNTSAAGGAGVRSIVDNTGASRSRLQAGDVITKLNGDLVSDYNSLEAAKKKHKPGDVVRITYLRGDKKTTTRLTLGSLADRDVREVRMLEDLCGEIPAETKSNAPTKVENKMPKVSSGASLDVFPNPAKDIVTLQFDGGANAQATISVLTIEGKEVMRREVNENTEQFTEQIDLSKLPAGMYIVTVKQGETVISKQVALKSN